MKKVNKSQRGFSAIEALLIVVIVGIVGLIGWYVRNNKTTLETAKPPATSSSSSKHKAVAGSASTSLVITKEDALNQPGVGGSYTKTVSSSDAKIILDDVRSFKPAPKGRADCNVCTGTGYSFKFTNPSLIVTSSGCGCDGFIIVNDKTYVSTNTFWNDVAKATGQPRFK